MDWPCHALPKDKWCDHNRAGGFMGHTCVRTPEVELTRDERLVLLIEECGEVIQAATKCLRFGFDRDQPGYGVNSAVLAAEVGDLLGVVDALPLNRDISERFRKAKIAKATRIKAEIGDGQS